MCAEEGINVVRSETATGRPVLGPVTEVAHQLCRIGCERNSYFCNGLCNLKTRQEHRCLSSLLIHEHTNLMAQHMDKPETYIFNNLKNA